MTSIIYIGMDVHTESISICAYSKTTENFFGETTFKTDADEIEKYLSSLTKGMGVVDEIRYICGYEAGCLGYSLYRALTAKNIECVILAPSTMALEPTAGKKKNDRLDARRVAKCLAFGTYSKVHATDEEDDAVKEYIRMRDDTNSELKRTKQQIIAFCVRHGYAYDGTKHKWTKQHREWLNKLAFAKPVLRETLDEYLLRLKRLEEEIENYDRRIEELAETDRYRESVKKLGCLKGIATHTALSLVSEIGDFNRFPTAQCFSSYLGLTPGEHSSGGSHHTLGITKLGNTHLRRLLVESAQSFNKGSIGQKSAALKKRQNGNSNEIIHYADRANERLRRKYARISSKTSSNIAKVAIARELACFIWGIMTGHIA